MLEYGKQREQESACEQRSGVRKLVNAPQGKPGRQRHHQPEQRRAMSQASVEHAVSSDIHPPRQNAKGGVNLRTARIKIGLPASHANHRESPIRIQVVPHGSPRLTADHLIP
jgi:hypothetical protein